MVEVCLRFAYVTLLAVVYSLVSLHLHFKIVKENTKVFYFLHQCHNIDAITALKCVHF